MFLFVIALFWLYWHLSNVDGTVKTQSSLKDQDAVNSVLVPGGNRYEVVEHTYYTLGYDESNEQAAWVSYLLRREDLRLPKVSRADRFEDDPLVSTGSATYFDYSGSGYDRGHLIPAADLAFSKEAMASTFYMSNMSPQARAFNGGIWRELEELVRDWAFKNEELYVVTGPILSSVTHFIGKKNKVGVPALYYKAVLDHLEPEIKAIAFIMPNELSEEPVMNYAVTIDSLESLLGLDIFRGILPADTEQKVENQIDKILWPTNANKQKLRIENWNKR